MIKNYLSIAVRNFLRHKGFALISTFSLVVGITCFIFLMLYVKYEVTYDSFHKNSGRIFQIGMNITKGDMFGFKQTTLLSGVMVPTIKKEFPEVEYAARVKKNESSLSYGNNGFIAKGLYADEDFFNVFTFPLKTGNMQTALKDPYTIVLSESLAGKLFGKENPLGKVVKLGGNVECNVTAVVKDPPANTNFIFEYILSFSTLASRNKYIENSWGMIDWPSYVLLKDKVSSKDFESKLARIVDKYHPSFAKDREYFLIPIGDFHFLSSMLTDTKLNSDKSFVVLLGTIAFIVLLIGCVNYMNLATARAGTRSKEVGIRKTVGANRLQLMKQFLSESFILTFASILMSLLLIYILFPYLKQIAGNGIDLNILGNSSTIIGLILLFVAVGFISGSYPAFMLSSLKPVNVLKSSGQNRISGNSLKFRNVLVVFQFCITIILVIAAVVVQKQLHFIKNSDIGYNRDNIVAVKIRDNESRLNYQLIKNELLKNTNVRSIAFSSVEPISIRNIGPTKIENDMGEMKDVDGMVSNYFVDFDYFNLLNIQIVKGRSFSQEFSGDIGKQVIINETAARLIDLKNPIGKKVEREGRQLEIVGVVKDFHFASMKTKIDPLILTFQPEYFAVMLAKVSNKNINTTIADINTECRKFSKSFVFEYSFMDDLYEKLYKKENDLSGIVLYFSIITIIIASIGLLGLISFIVGKKTKEIGVRKILGASVLQVIWLIVKEFFVLMVVAMVIAVPAAYYLTNGWLQEFVYRIDLSVWLFVLATSIIVLVAFLSIAQQVIKAAVTNPADSLRSE